MMRELNEKERAVLVAAVVFHNDVVRAWDEGVPLAEVAAMHEHMVRQRRNVGWAAMDAGPDVLAFGAWLSSRLLSTWRFLQTSAEGGRVPVRPTTIEISAPVQP
ncbi:hypothetical protein [Mesorhizobium australicum]|uniref:Uncharacterized protein n=1 Tax=Mesorhizobium australicum TaxID=536018 RepID=A0A1X7MZ38_9HYPH|nr:hypothetical protein [Mesorhizobium australicum]SMH30159.1 hypothetical protein SAMN02982922_1005 [Mesorhizobium australicum]